jgi:Tol biopolymer transport system component
MKIGARTVMLMIITLLLSGCYLLFRDDGRCQGTGVSEALPAIDPKELQGRIIFVSFRDNYKGELYVMNADGTNALRLTHNHLSERYPSVSENSKTVIFSLASGGIYTLDLDKCLQRPAGCEATLNQLRFTGRDPEYSPDGTRIVFIEDDVMVMNADGSEAQRTGMLPATPSRVLSPTWGRNGQQIAAVAQQYGDNLYLATLDEAQQISTMTLLAHGLEPAVAPDNSQFVMSEFVVDGHWSCLCLVPSDGKSPPQRLTTFSAMQPTWSPDGRWIAFVHEGKIGVIDPQGTRLLYLTDDGEDNTMPYWFR